jgi:large subunit ribosomal protein L11
VAKKITGYIKLQIKAGAANPAPPIGPALGSKKVNISEFCKQYNARTQSMAGQIVPVIITVYADNSFTFVTKTPPVPSMIKVAAKVETASGEPNRKKVGKITAAQVTEIAKTKMPDLNTISLESAESMVRGTARSMGIEVV